MVDNQGLSEECQVKISSITWRKKSIFVVTFYFYIYIKSRKKPCLNFESDKFLKLILKNISTFVKWKVNFAFKMNISYRYAGAS